MFINDQALVSLALPHIHTPAPALAGCPPLWHVRVDAHVLMNACVGMHPSMQVTGPSMVPTFSGHGGEFVVVQPLLGWSKLHVGEPRTQPPAVHTCIHVLIQLFFGPFGVCQRRLPWLCMRAGPGAVLERIAQILPTSYLPHT